MTYHLKITALYFLLRLLWRLFSLTVVLIGLLSLGVYVSVVSVEHYHHRVQDWLALALQQPLKIQTVRGEWQDWTAVLHFGASELGERGDGTPMAGFKQARLRVDLVESILKRQWITQDIYVQKAYFTGRSGARPWLETSDSGVATLPRSHAPAWERQGLLHWFLQQNHIQLEQADVIGWSPNQAPAHFSHINLNLTRYEQSRVRGEKKSRTLLSLECEAELRSPSQSRVRGEKKQSCEGGSPACATKRSRAPYWGQLRFHAQADWAGLPASQISAWEGLQVKGQLQAQNLHLASSEAELSLPKVSADFHYESSFDRTPLANVAHNWLLQVDTTAFLGEGLPPSHIKWVAKPNADLSGSLLEGHIDFLRLNEFVPLLRDLSPLPADVKHALSVMRPQAELHDTHFRVPMLRVGTSLPRENATPASGRAKGADTWTLSTHFRKASLRGNSGHRVGSSLPDFNNIAGVLSLSPTVGSLTLDSQDAQIFLPSFASAWDLDSLHGTIAWQRQSHLMQDSWLLHSTDLQLSNADAQHVSLRGQVLLPANGDAPNADLMIQGFGIAANRLERYVPINAPNTRRWMKRGLRGGLIDKAVIHLRGPLEHDHLLLQDTGQNGLQGLLQVRDGHIIYAPGWSALQQVQGTVRIDGDSLFIDGQQGQVMRHALRHVRVSLHDLDSGDAHIRVQGRSEGAAVDALQFIQNSPLSRNIDVGDLRLTGAVNIDLDMRIPLDDGQEDIRGSVHFSDSDLTHGLLDSVRLPLRHIRGQLHFTDQGLMAEQLHAEWLGRPIQLSLQHPANSPDAEKSLQVDLKGSADRGFLQQLFNRLLPELETWTRFVAGSAQWQARLFLPDDATRAAQVRVTSNLQGMSLDMPEPFGKKARESRDLSFATSLGKQALGRLRYAEDVNLAYQGDSLAIHFGKQAAVLKPQAGWQISGHLPEIDLQEWHNRLTALDPDGLSDAPTVPREAAVAPLARLLALGDKSLLVDLSSEHLLLNTHSQQQAHLQGFVNAQNGLLYFNSKQAEAKLDYTQNPPQVNLLFTRLHVPKAAATAADTRKQTQPNYLNTMLRLAYQNAPLDPRHLPPLSVYCESLKIADIELGSLELQAAPSLEGFALKHLNLNTPGFNATASGLWAYRKQGSSLHAPDIQSTELNIHLYADTTAGAFAQLGQDSSAIVGGQTQVHFEGGWPGNPLQFHQAHLKGRLSIDIGRGQIEAVELGAAGRLVGLLDFNSLTHRLSLDFRDVFEKGFGFNRISGEFFLEGGHAYTDGIQLKGSIADIEIAGRTGLLDQTYEQDVIVMPHLSNTLPIGAAVAGGPAVGIIVLILQALLKNDLKQAVKYHYRITGKWDEPHIVLLSENNADNEAAD